MPKIDSLPHLLGLLTAEDRRQVITDMAILGNCFIKVDSFGVPHRLDPANVTIEAYNERHRTKT